MAPEESILETLRKYDLRSGLVPYRGTVRSGDAGLP